MSRILRAAVAIAMLGRVQGEAAHCDALPDRLVVVDAQLRSDRNVYGARRWPVRLFGGRRGRFAAGAGREKKDRKREPEQGRSALRKSQHHKERGRGGSRGDTVHAGRMASAWRIDKKKVRFPFSFPVELC